MSDERYARLAEDLTTKLGLELPPVAIAYVESAPEGVEVFGGEVPSACSFWREAESRPFYAPAEKHFNCAVGAMTMGFQLPDGVRDDLMGAVKTMTEAGYIGEDEPAKMPIVRSGHAGIVYGPLRDFPVRADLVVMWLRPPQAMLFNEASGDVRWSGGGHMPALGRPACSALPTALSESKPALSLGCIGMRTFTEISGDRLLTVLPMGEVDGFVDRLGAVVEANRAMAEVYNTQKSRFAGTR